MANYTDNSKLMELLSTMMNRPEVKGAWFNGKKIKLDGYRFIGCRFDNCTLTLSSTNFEIEDCFIDNSSLIEYAGEIVKPIKLFNSRYDWVYQNMPFFAPTKNSDGTITIKG
ncbi:hypothetical protein GN155_007580 [Alcanivorax sp. ZXX171]|nr:hypothetical protein [Alcanivorax sp. ZXX171]